jgi:CheY-like chemotaxis protein
MTEKAPEILIVDDARTMRMIVKAVLAGMNTHFDEAQDGQEAYDLIKAKQNNMM